MSAVNVSFADEADDNVDVDNDYIEKCINARILKRTEVVDDRHILFFLSGQKVYLNILPDVCSGLSRERRFSYTTLNRSLCRFDSIRVLSDVGGTIHQGRSCRLGYFHLTSKEEIEAAQERQAEPPPIKQPEGADVEEIE
jgi:hypothetical protein